mgnify:CR=1 FL=1
MLHLPCTDTWGSIHTAGGLLTLSQLLLIRQLVLQAMTLYKKLFKSHEWTVGFRGASLSAVTL